MLFFIRDICAEKEQHMGEETAVFILERISSEPSERKELE